MFAAEARGDLPKGTAKEWAHKTKSIKSLPEHVKKHAFVEGFNKVAGTAATAGKLWHNPKALDYAGLGLLGAFPAHDVYKSVTGSKEKEEHPMLRGATELGGLGLLARSVAKAKH